MALAVTPIKHLNGVEIDLHTHDNDFALWEQQINQPEVLFSKDLSYEAEIEEQTRALLASAALQNTITIDYEPDTYQDLATALKQAKLDTQARNMAEINAKTDYLERAYKSGHIGKVTLQVKNGELSQHGQRMTHVNANSLRYLSSETLQSRARIETHNAFRQQRYFNTGILRDYTMVTFSLVPERIDSSEAKRLGFFTENMSLAIQTLRQTSENKAELESAFVAGADNPGQRFDIEVVKKLLNQLGLNADDLDTEQILANPILVPNELIKNGAVDIVAYYDHIASEKTGVKRFYGRRAYSDQNYQAHKNECLHREQVADEIAKRTTDKLISEVTNFKLPTDATRRLHELNDAELKQRIVHDTTIDANVLGVSVVSVVNQARMFYRENDVFGLQQMVQLITLKGVSNSCPTGGNSGESIVVGQEQLVGGETQADDTELSGKKEMTCPFCKEKTVGDPCADCITCTKCSASTKYSADENKRRAEQYRKIKQLKQASSSKIESVFNSFKNSATLKLGTANYD